MNKQIFRIPENMPHQARNAPLVIWAYLVVSIVVGSYFAFRTIQTPSWQLWTTTLLVFATTISSVIALILVRRRHLELGVWLTIAASYVAAIGIVISVSGVGALLLAGSVLLSFLIAVQTLRSRQAAMIVAGIVVGIATLFMDLFLTTESISAPGFQSLIYYILPIMLAMFGYVILRQYRNYSLRTKLIVVAVSIVLVAVGIQAFISIRSISANLQSTENEALLRAAEQTAANIDEHINAELTFVRVAAQITDFGKFLGTDPSLRDERLQQETISTLQSMIKRDPVYILSYSLLNKQGVDVLDTNSGAIGVSHANEDYFKQAIQTDLPHVSSVKFLPDGRAVLYFANSIHDENGESAGILLATYDATILQKWIVQTNSLTDAQSFPILFDENHVRLAHGDAPELIFKSVMPLDTAKLTELQAASRMPNLPADQLSTNLPELENALVNADTAPNFTTKLVATGEETNASAVVRTETQPWQAAYFEPTSVYLAPVQEQTRNSLIFAVLVSFVIALVGVGTAQILSAPIVRLTAIAEQVAAGNLNAQAKVESTDEIGVLAKTFNSMTSQLRDSIGTLEERVAERTHSLELAVDVGRAVSQVRALDIMLKDAAELIRSRFDLYYVQVYLTDHSQTNLILQTGTGKVGAELIGRSHRLPLNTASINGRAATEKRSVIIADTAASAAFLPNPLLPDTRSEIAVPLLIGEKVVGVLDLQSQQANALNQDILSAFEALAGQLAIAIQNATFLAETEQAHAEVEAQARRLTRANWADYLDAIYKPEETGFVFEQNKIVPLEREKQTQIAENSDALVAPIAVTGEALGNLVVEMEGQSPILRTSELVNTVARQVAQQIENLRLLDSAERYRFEAEQASRRITREGWKTYKEKTSENLSYHYDLKEVRPFNGDSLNQPASIVPLKVRDELVGTLSIQGLSPDDKEAIDFANSVAERLSAHLESLRQFEETKRGQVELDKRAQQLAAVAEISTASSKELDIDRMLASVVHLTQRKFGLYHAHVFTFNENSQALEIQACGWKEGDEHEGTHGTTIIPLAQEQSLVARAARTKQAVIVNDVRNESGWLPNPLLPDTASELAVPLIIGDQVLGVLDVQSDRLNAFSEEDANIQTTLASQVATALQNARTFTQAQQQAERESTLNVISQKIQSATTVEAVLQIAARELGHALGAPMTIAQLSMRDKK